MRMQVGGHSTGASQGQSASALPREAGNRTPAQLLPLRGAHSHGVERHRIASGVDGGGDGANRRAWAGRPR